MAQAPYRIGKRLRVVLSSQALKKGTRVGRWVSTRSMTTLRGQGRKTVREASKTMASTAHHNCFRKWRSSGKKCGSHRLVLFPAWRFRGVLIMTASCRFARSARPREFDLSPSILQLQECGAVTRNPGKCNEHSFCGFASQHLRLEVHARVAILDIERVNIRHSFVFFKSKSD